MSSGGGGRLYGKLTAEAQNVAGFECGCAADATAMRRTANPRFGARAPHFGRRSIPVRGRGIPAHPSFPSSIRYSAQEVDRCPLSRFTDLTPLRHEPVSSPTRSTTEGCGCGWS